VLSRVSRFSLKKQKGKKLAFQKGRYDGPLFSLVVYEREQLATGQMAGAQAALIVSSRVSKKAVVRNRLKRLLREAARNILPQVKPGFALVLLAKPALREKNLAEIQAELEKMVSKANLAQQNEKDRR